MLLTETKNSKQKNRKELHKNLADVDQFVKFLIRHFFMVYQRIERDKRSKNQGVRLDHPSFSQINHCFRQSLLELHRPGL